MTDRKKEALLAMQLAEAMEHGSVVDEEIDRFINGGYKTKFKLAKYIKGYQLTAPVVAMMAPFWRSDLLELQEATSGDAPELRKAYLASMPELKRFCKFMESLIDDCDKFVTDNPPRKRTRTPKVYTPTELVSKMKFLPAFPELGLEGLPPENVIGVPEAWFYDTDKRKLVLYRAASGAGLSMKGTTVQNYDEKTSGSHTIRKPATFFADLKMGYRGLNRDWSLIRGKISPLKGRINRDMVFLAVG